MPFAPRGNNASQGRRSAGATYDVTILEMYAASSDYNLSEFDAEYRVAGAESPGQGTVVNGCRLSYSEKNGGVYYVNFPENLQFERDESNQLVRDEFGKAKLISKMPYVKPPYAAIEALKQAAIAHYHAAAEGGAESADDVIYDENGEEILDPFAE